MFFLIDEQTIWIHSDRSGGIFILVKKNCTGVKKSRQVKLNYGKSYYKN